MLVERMTSKIITRCFECFLSTAGTFALVLYVPYARYLLSTPRTGYNKQQRIRYVAKYVIVNKHKYSWASKPPTRAGNRYE